MAFLNSSTTKGRPLKEKEKKIMSSFHESQLEQAFVELFQKEGYDYVYGECILRGYTRRYSLR